MDHQGKKLTLISQYFYPEMISTGHLLTELLQQLVTKGMRVSVICAQPTYYSTEKVDSHITFKGISITRTPNAQYDKNSIKGKLLNSISFFISAVLMACAQKQGGVILVVTNPPFLGLLGPIIKSLKKRPFLLIVHDLYPDILMKMGYLRPHSLTVQLWHALNQWIFRKAHFIVTLGRDMQKALQDKLPNTERPKVKFIPNWADPFVVRPVDTDENFFLKELGFGKKFIVQYSGNMGLTHDMETIIKAAWHLIRDESIQFLLIGGGGKLKKIKDMARYYKLQNVTFLPYQPRENLKYSLSAAHVSLIALESSVTGLSVPSKLYGIMASGRPIVAIVPENSEVALTLREFKCGLITTPKDDLALAETISWLKVNESARETMGNQAYKAFLENFTVQNCADKYSELLKKMI